MTSSSGQPSQQWPPPPPPRPFYPPPPLPPPPQQQQQRRSRSSRSECSSSECSPSTSPSPNEIRRSFASYIRNGHSRDDTTIGRQRIPRDDDRPNRPNPPLQLELDDDDDVVVAPQLDDSLSTLGFYNSHASLQRREQQRERDDCDERSLVDLANRMAAQTSSDDQFIHSLHAWHAELKAAAAKAVENGGNDNGGNDNGGNDNGHNDNGHNEVDDAYNISSSNIMINEICQRANRNCRESIFDLSDSILSNEVSVRVNPHEYDEYEKRDREDNGYDGGSNYDFRDDDCNDDGDTGELNLCDSNNDEDGFTPRSRWNRIASEENGSAHHDDSSSDSMEGMPGPIDKGTGEYRGRSRTSPSVLPPQRPNRATKDHLSSINDLLYSINGMLLDNTFFDDLNESIANSGDAMAFEREEVSPGSRDASGGGSDDATIDIDYASEEKGESSSSSRPVFPPPPPPPRTRAADGGRPEVARILKRERARGNNLKQHQHQHQCEQQYEQHQKPICAADSVKEVSEEEEESPSRPIIHWNDKYDNPATSEKLEKKQFSKQVRNYRGDGSFSCDITNGSRSRSSVAGRDSVLVMANRLDAAPTIEDPPSIEGAIDAEYAAASDALAASRSKHSRKIAKRQLRGTGRSIKIDAGKSGTNNDISGESFGNGLESSGGASSSRLPRRRHPPVTTAAAAANHHRRRSDGNSFEAADLDGSENVKAVTGAFGRETIGQNTDDKVLNSMSGMASRLEKSHVLEDPSIVEGTNDAQYRKNGRGESNSRRQMRGSGHAIGVSQRGSTAKNKNHGTARSGGGKTAKGKKMSPSEHRKLHHEKRKLKRIQENNDQQRKQELANPDTRLSRGGKNAEEQIPSPGERRKLHHENRKLKRMQERNNQQRQQQQQQQEPSSSATSALANKARDSGGSSAAIMHNHQRGRQRQQQPQHQQLQQQQQQQQQHPPKTSLLGRLKHRGKNKKKTNNSFNNSHPSLRSSRDSSNRSSSSRLRRRSRSCSSNRSRLSRGGSPKSGTKSVRSSGSATRSVGSDGSGKSAASIFSVISKSAASFGSKKSRISESIGGDDGSRRERRRHPRRGRRSSGEMRSNNARRHLKSNSPRYQNGSRLSQQRNDKTATAATTAANASRVGISSYASSANVKTSLTASAAASLAEHQNKDVPRTVDRGTAASWSIDDLSSCDSSASFGNQFEDEDDDDDFLGGNYYDDENEELYYDDGSCCSASSPVMVVSVAEAVQHLNQQNKLERAVAAAAAKTSGLRLKMIRPR